MSSKAATAPTAIEAAEAELETVEGRLRELRAEQADIPRQLKVATASANVDAVLRLRERGDRLQVEIPSARVVMLRAQIRLLEAQRADPCRAEAWEQAVAEGAAAQVRLQEAQAAVAATQAVVADLQGRDRDLARDIGQAKREISELLAQLTTQGQGPVMRAAWMASARP
jgi:chromosome segregation ATPase